MTGIRRPAVAFLAVLFAVTFLTLRAARADEADAQDASTAAAVPARSWLRDTKKPVQASLAAQPSGSPWRPLGVLLVLGGLGVSALVAKRRRVATAVLPESSTRVRVLSSARVGPKASAVVAEVNGRVMLLGVTDTHVARLAWLDAPARAQVASRGARALSSEPVEVLPDPRKAPVETRDEEEANYVLPGTQSIASRFSSVLDRALGVKPAMTEDFRANPGVAALLAASVEDVVHTPNRVRTVGPIGGSRAPIVEDQAAGLSRRRGRT